MGVIGVPDWIDAAFSQRPLVHIWVYMCVCGGVCVTVFVLVGVFVCMW